MPRSARAGLRLQRRFALTREEIEKRPKNLWRYRELLPITGEPRTGFNSGFTPLVRCDRLAERLGVSELYIKDDSVNHPTLSYKDRVVSVAATRAVELGFKVLACASTGNLANSVSAHAARLGIECCVFIPDNLEAGKLLGSAIFNPTILAIAGNYDDVNRLCTQVADRYGWGFVNINLRSYYAEGAKTMGFEIAEQLGWRYPRMWSSPVAGGTLLPRIVRGLRELREVGLVDGELPRVHAAQAAGCAPGRPRARRRPRASGAGAARHDREVDRHRQSGRRLSGARDACGRRAAPGAAVTDEQIVDAIQLLARNRRHLHRAGGRHDAGGGDRPDRARRHPRDESIVVCVTGNGYKTAEVVDGNGWLQPVRLSRAFKEFEAWCDEASPDQALGFDARTLNARLESRSSDR